jgi:hypothetical protein
MDDPTPRREPGNEMRPSGLLSQAGASISFRATAANYLADFFSANFSKSGNRIKVWLDAPFAKR